MTETISAERRRRGSVLRSCIVCGDRAHSLHFGGLSCDSCKAFFRRSVQSGACHAFYCAHTRTCAITIASRRCCQACRYAKCLSAGMEPGWVLSEQERHQKCLKKDSEQSIFSRKDYQEKEEHNYIDLEKFLSPSELRDLNIIVSVFKRACENSVFCQFSDSLSPDVNGSERLNTWEYDQRDVKEAVQLVSQFCSSFLPFVNLDDYFQFFDSALAQMCLIYIAAKSKPIPDKHSLYVETSHVQNNAQRFVQNEVHEQQSPVACSCPREQVDYCELCCDSTFRFQTTDKYGPNMIMQTPHQFNNGWNVSDLGSVPYHNQHSNLFDWTDDDLEAQFIKKMQKINMDEPTLLLLLIVTMLNPCHSDGPWTSHVGGIQEYYTLLLWRYLEWKHGPEQGVAMLPQLLSKVVDVQSLTQRDLSTTKQTTLVRLVQDAIRNLDVKREPFQPDFKTVRSDAFDPKNVRNSQISRLQPDSNFRNAFYGESNESYSEDILRLLDVNCLPISKEFDVIEANEMSLEEDLKVLENLLLQNEESAYHSSIPPAPHGAAWMSSNGPEQHVDTVEQLWDLLIL